MEKTKYDWHPIEEMDSDDGTHTCYATEIGDFYIYCTQMHDGTWNVESKRKHYEGFVTLAICKTLTSAKRWVARYLR